MNPSNNCTAMKTLKKKSRKSFFTVFFFASSWKIFFQIIHETFIIFLRDLHSIRTVLLYTFHYRLSIPFSIWINVAYNIFLFAFSFVLHKLYNAEQTWDRARFTSYHRIEQNLWIYFQIMFILCPCSSDVSFPQTLHFISISSQTLSPKT